MIMTERQQDPWKVAIFTAGSKKSYQIGHLKTGFPVSEFNNGLWSQKLSAKNEINS